MTEAHLEDFPRFVIAGRLDRDTILPISGPANRAGWVGEFTVCCCGF